MNDPTPLMAVCAWCGGLIRDGDPRRGVSHGICPVCFVVEASRYNEQLAREEEQRR